MDNRAIKKLESDLWEAADLLRQGSKLTSQQYCMPVLGMLFLNEKNQATNHLLPKSPTASDLFIPAPKSPTTSDKFTTNPETLVSRLSFSHKEVA